MGAFGSVAEISTDASIASLEPGELRTLLLLLASGLGGALGLGLRLRHGCGWMWRSVGECVN